jgi:hypothetical protein
MNNDFPPTLSIPISAMSIDKTLVALPCVLMLGAFPSERVFEVEMANGKNHSGLAPRYFCWNEHHELIGPDDSQGQANGMVAAKLIEQLEGDQFAVEVPDGEVIAVNKDQIHKRPTPIVPPGLVASTAN